MSLSISFISKHDAENTDWEEALEAKLPPGHNSLFGFETYRKVLWGHDIMKELGCETIYSLGETDIYVFGYDMLMLENELIKILENIDLVSEETGIDKEGIERRVKNALEYVHVAKADLNNVRIWIS